MANLSQLRTAYLQGQLTKPQYIQGMAEQHQTLFGYLPLLQDGEIASIEITPEGVIFTTRSPEIRFLCPQLDWRVAPIESFNFGAYEPTETAMVLRLLEPGFQVFDIGANVGWYTLQMAKRQPLTIYAFEPVPATYAQLLTNLSLNQVERIHTYNLGFSDQATTLTFYRQPSTSVSASMTNITDDPNSDGIHAQVQRLDDFVAAENLSVDFVKCDVEGSELLVFRGGLSTLQRDRPIIFTEMLRKWSAKFNYHPNDIIDLLRGLGYRCFRVQGDHLAALDRMDDQTQETNFFFLHTEQHQAQIQRWVDIQ